MSEQTEALAVAKPEEKTERAMSRVANLNPRNFTEAWGLARVIAKSEVCPKDYRNKPESVLIAMQMGSEVGLAPLQSLQSIATINGRPSLWGDAALALCQTNPKFEWSKEWWEGQGETRVAICQVKRQGNEVHETRFSVADAKRAGLWGKQGPWSQYPDRMQQMRARGFCLRDKFPDSLKGLMLTEEVMDIPVDQRKPIETGKLDVSAEVGLLAESSEPNRGHGNEAFGQPTIDAKGICSECKAQGGHLPNCSLRKNGGNGVSKPPAESKAPEPQPEPEVVSPPKETRTAGLVRGLVKVKDVEAKMKKIKGKDDQPYFLLIPTDPKAAPIYVWHQSLHEFAVKMKGREVDLELSRSDSQGKTFWSLENIYSVTDPDGSMCKFVNNQPVLEQDTGEYVGQPTGDELFPPVHVDKG